MSHWRENTDTLHKWLSKPRRGLITDMDGTVSHIVSHPDDAVVTPQNLTLLKQLHEKLELVAVITGRAVEDVRQKFDTEELIYVGNHGMEQWENGEVIIPPEIAAYRPNIKAVIEQLQPHAVEGMWLEDKQTNLSIHYRNVENPDDVSQNFHDILAPIVEANDLVLFPGRKIFEVRPPVEINKGAAFQNLIKTHNLDAALYIGDDTTDVDAFKVAQQLREASTCYTLAIGVESDDMPQAVANYADMMVSGVSDVEAFLSWLLSASSASLT